MKSSHLTTSFRRGTSAFTLFEVLIAIAILALGMTAIGRAVNMAFRATAASDAHMKALNFARLELERLREKAFYTPDLADGTRTFVNAITNGTAVTTYTGTVKVTTRQSSPFLKDVSVQVDWRTPYQKSAPLPVELQTTLAKSLRS